MIKSIDETYLEFNVISQEQILFFGIYPDPEGLPIYYGITYSIYEKNYGLWTTISGEWNKFRVFNKHPGWPELFNSLQERIQEDNP